MEQRFPAPPDAVISAYSDPKLYEAMVGLSRVEPPTVVDVTRKGDTVVVRVRFRFIADIPSAARTIVDPGRLTWIDESTYDLVTHQSVTRLHPDHYADRLTASATSRFDPDPVHPGHTVRRISGDLRVRAPLVASRVERAIVDGLREHLADEGRVVAEHLGTPTD
jgi:hypothetical protein